MRQWILEARTDSTTWDAGLHPERFSLCAGLRRGISNHMVINTQHRWMVQYRLRHRITREVIYCDRFV